MSERTKRRNAAPERSAQHQAALAYAARGWRVFPVYASTASGGCDCPRPSCKAQGKHPHIEDWQNVATSDATTISSWWEKWPNANIGIATGRESDLWVLDIDTVEGADHTLKLCGDEAWKDTLTAVTGRGRHLYFRYPLGQEVFNRTGVGPGLDVRGNGGYVIGPGSIHKSGRRYEWVDSSIPVASAPECLLELVTTRTIARSPGQRIPKGTRHDAFVRSAGSMRGTHGMGPQAIEATLLQEMAPLCASPMTADRRQDTYRIANDIGNLPMEVENPDTLPLDEYVATAIGENRIAYEGRRTWCSPFFHLVRKLKCRTEFAGKDAFYAAELLETSLVNIANGAAPVWEYHFGSLDSEPRMLFIETWDEVKVSENGNPLQDAYDEAKHRRLFPPEFSSERFSLFISVVGLLQLRSPGRSIAISVEAFASLLGCHRNTISTYLKYAQRLNLLALAKQSSYEKRLAAEYHFHIDQWDLHSGNYLGPRLEQSH
jgi:hypothetical protein